MGFPIIMYLSKSKVGMFWKDKNRKKPSISSIKSNLSFSVNPAFSVETEFKNKENMEISRVEGSDNWPPYESLEIALSMEKQLRKKSQIGTMDDFLNKNYKHPCYKLKGKLFINSMTEDVVHRDIKCHGTKGVLVLDGTEKEVLVDISYDNIAGMSFRNEHWEAWESGAYHFLHDVSSRGYDLIGLFTYEGESDKYYAECGILYFASMRGKSYYGDKEIEKTIYNEYI